MPLIPNFVERWVLRRNLAPGFVLDLIGATAFHSASLASDLGFFEELEKRPQNAEDLAERTSCSVQGTKRLLAYLAETGYLKKVGDIYRNSSLTRRWLLSSSAGNMANFVNNWKELLVETWPENLEQSVRTGTLKINFQDWMSLKDGRWEKFNKSMASMAGEPAVEIAARVQLPPNPRRLLDIGGNHGKYAAAFCQRYPGLTATIFDVGDALDYSLTEQSAQIVLQAGDIERDDLGRDYDVVFISNVIHYFSESECRDIVRRSVEALSPGGIMIISDQSANAKGSHLLKTFLKMMSLHYLVVTGSDVFSEVTVISWMEDVGCKHVRTISLRKSPGQMVIVAQKNG